MAERMQGPQSQTSRGRRRFPWVLWSVIGSVILAIAIFTIITVVVLERQGISQGATTLTVLSIIVSMITGLLGLLITFLQWHSPRSSGDKPSANDPPSISSPPTIVLQVPTSTLPSSISASPATTASKTPYRGIQGFPPPTDPRSIQQREKAVKEVYALLTLPEVTAVVLTGIGGVGKSTLAALISRYAEAQRQLGNGPFTAEPIWLKVDVAVTMTDLAGSLFAVLGLPLPEFASLAPQSQAVTLFNALNTPDHACLIILDQFENLLDAHTGYALPDRPGLGEWLDALNSQPCASRVLLTSRPRSLGTRDYPATHMQEYPVHGLEPEEGVELLRKQGVVGTDADLVIAVERCSGHAFALTLLASLLRSHGLRLDHLFKDQRSSQLWTGDIAQNLLDRIYTQQLDAVQRKLLLAFSVYREPVPLEAAEALADLDPAFSHAQMQTALKGLLAQHLLQPAGGGCYQLHTIVASYAGDHFDETGEQGNRQARRAAHALAAQYYLRQAAQDGPPRQARRHISDVHPFVEAVWQLCQADQQSAAYALVEQEYLFTDLKLWGGNVLVLELCLLLLPSQQWQPERSQAASIYNNLGGVYDVLGKREQALRYFDEALNIYKALGDRQGEGTILSRMARVYNAQGQKKRALEYYEEALSIFREIGDRSGEATILNNLGRVYNVLESKAEALRYYKQALAIFREIGDRNGEGIVLDHLGWLSNAIGNREEGLKYSEEALSILREVGDRSMEGRAYNALGRIYSSLNDLEKARHYYEEALSILREVSDRSGEGRVLDNLGRVYSVLGEKTTALRYYEEALNISREVDDRGGEGTTLNNLGRVYTELDQRDRAYTCLKASMAIRQEVGDRSGEGETLHSLGSFYFSAARYDLAIACFIRARAVFEDVHSPEREVSQRWLDDILRTIGPDRFDVWLKQADTQPILTP